MADIRNDQYLHRPGAGRGAITPADPLEVRLYGPNGQPISSSNRLPVDAAVAGLETLATAEKQDLVKGVLDAINSKVATDQGVGLVASAVEALAQIAATESTLSQAVQKLESIVNRLQNTLTVDGEVQLKGQLMQIVAEYKDVPYNQGDGLTGSIGTLHFGENMHAEGGRTRFLDVAAYPHIDVLLYNDTDVDLLAGVRIFPVPGISERNYYGLRIFRNEVISNREVKKGDYLWIRSIEEPQLNRVAAISAHFQIKDNVPTEGTLSVIFLGSRI